MYIQYNNMIKNNDLFDPYIIVANREYKYVYFLDKP